VVGVSERGSFDVAYPTTVINRNTVLVFAGTEKNLAAFDEVYSFYHICRLAGDPVLIIGGGVWGAQLLNV